LSNDKKPSVSGALDEQKVLDDAVDSQEQSEFNQMFFEMRERAEKAGFLTEDEIEAEIAVARAQRAADSIE